MFVTTEPQEGGFLLRIESDEIRLDAYLNDGSSVRGQPSPEWNKEVVNTFVDIFLACKPGEKVVMVG